VPATCWGVERFLEAEFRFSFCLGGPVWFWGGAGGEQPGLPVPIRGPRLRQGRRGGRSVVLSAYRRSALLAGGRNGPGYDQRRCEGEMCWTRIDNRRAGDRQRTGLAAGGTTRSDGDAKKKGRRGTAPGGAADWRAPPFLPPQRRRDGARGHSVSAGPDNCGRGWALRSF